MSFTKSDTPLELEACVEELSPAQLAQFEKVANEHNALKNALKTALSENEGKELFNGDIFQAYSFKGEVLQEFKEATLPQKRPKSAEALQMQLKRERKCNLHCSNLESSDDEDDVPLVKLVAKLSNKKGEKAAVKEDFAPSAETPECDKDAAAANVKIPPQTAKTPTKDVMGAVEGNAPAVRPSENTAIGGLLVDIESKQIIKDGDGDKGKGTKFPGKTFPSLVVVAKPWLNVRDISASCDSLDSKVKLLLMLTPNQFTETLIQKGLLKAEQRCVNHRYNELKLSFFSDTTKFPFTGGYVWISECCPMRLVSVFHGSIFESAPHPPSCILKLIYHWSCQTNIQNVVQWVKIDHAYIKRVYTWLRAICKLAIRQKCKQLGGADKFVEAGVISLGTISRGSQERQVKVKILGVFDRAEKTIRLRAVEPLAVGDHNHKRHFQNTWKPLLQRWVQKDSIICIDPAVDKSTLYGMGFKNIVQAAATDSTAKHTNATIMDYLRHIVPRMFQNTLALLSRQMIQQFLDELVWREQFGTDALQAFESITSHIAEQTRMNSTESLTQRLYRVARNSS